MTTRVHFQKKPFDVFIARPSKWGNPFPIRKDRSSEELSPQIPDDFLLEVKNKTIDSDPDRPQRVVRMGSWSGPVEIVQKAHDKFNAEYNQGALLWKQFFERKSI